MEKITGKENTDDEIRAILIDALESKKANDFDEFCAAVLPGIEGFLKKYPVVWETIGESLRKIKAKKIMVVESGCSGTFPMLLRAVDERVEIRMYTTYPYLLDVYGDRIFTPAYEDNRLFETMYSQDKYYCFSNLTNEGYFVKRCEDEQVQMSAINEVGAFIIPQ